MKNKKDFNKINKNKKLQNNSPLNPDIKLNDLIMKLDIKAYLLLVLMVFVAPFVIAYNLIKDFLSKKKGKNKNEKRN